MILTSAVMVFLPSLGQKRRPGLFSDVLSNLTMVHPAYGVDHVDPVYWTLWSELRFYLLFAIVVAFGVTYRRVVLYCVLWSVAAMIASATDVNALKFITQPEQAPYFVAGIAFYLMYRFGPTLLLYGIAVFSFLLAQHLIRAEATVEGAAVQWHGYPMWPVQLILFAIFALMALIAHHKLDFITWRGLLTLGALTYPLYLLHQNIGFTFIGYLHNKIPAVPLVIVLYAAMLALSWLVYRLIERPASTWLNTHLTRSFDAMKP